MMRLLFKMMRMKKKAIEMNVIIWIIIGLATLTILFIGISYLVVKDFSLLEFIKSFLRTRG